MDEIKQTGGISIYPNPVSQTLNIQYNFKNNSKVRLEIFDVIGQQVYSRMMDNSENKTTVNTSNFMSGVYVVKLGNEKEQFVSKFVKQ